jgi:hypothetical protein
MRAWMPNITYGGHAFGFRKGRREARPEFQDFYEHRDEVLPWIREYSPYEHAGPGDPPVFLDYPAQDKPARVGRGAARSRPTRPSSGLKLQEKLRGQRRRGPAVRIPARRTPSTPTAPRS